MLFWGVVFGFLSFFLPAPLESEVKDYSDNGIVIEETKDEVARVVKLNNGVVLRFCSRSGRLMEFDYERNGLRYGRYIIGDYLYDFNNFDSVSYYQGCFFLHKKLDDNSMLRITVKDSVIIGISRFSNELTQA